MTQDRDPRTMRFLSISRSIPNRFTGELGGPVLRVATAKGFGRDIPLTTRDLLTIIEHAAQLLKGELRERQ